MKARGHKKRVAFRVIGRDVILNYISEIGGLRNGRYNRSYNGTLTYGDRTVQ